MAHQVERVAVNVFFVRYFVFYLLVNCVLTLLSGFALVWKSKRQNAEMRYSFKASRGHEIDSKLEQHTFPEGGRFFFARIFPAKITSPRGNLDPSRDFFRKSICPRGKPPCECFRAEKVMGAGAFGGGGTPVAAVILGGYICGLGVPDDTTGFCGHADPPLVRRGGSPGNSSFHEGILGQRTYALTQKHHLRNEDDLSNSSSLSLSNQDQQPRSKWRRS